MENTTTVTYEDKKWICTDKEIFQFARQTGAHTFEFKQFNWKNPLYEEPKSVEEAFEMNNWIEEEINLESYSCWKIHEYVTEFYKSIIEVKNYYPTSWEWVVAECIFEVDSEFL